MKETQRPKTKNQSPDKKGNRQYLVVGLGNPGAEYEWSRHNLGFMLIDKLSADAGIDVSRRECQSRVGRGKIEGAARVERFSRWRTQFHGLEERLVSVFAADFQGRG